MGLATEQKDDITRYLLGELPAAERAALEEKYFDDDELFAQLTERESDLISDYQHGRLSSGERRLFEQNYLRHPGRKAHADFIQSLSQTLAAQHRAPSWWERWRASWFDWNAPLAFAASVIAVLLLAGSVWVWWQNRQLRVGLQQAQVAQNDTAQRTQELQQQLSEQQQRNQELAAEIEQLRTPKAVITPEPQLGTAIVSLLLTASGSRATETQRPPELKLTPDTKQVRLILRLKKKEYAHYQARLEVVGGSVIWTQKNLNTSGMQITLIIPAHLFATGDYLLTLSGVSANGELDDVTQPFFRVYKP